MRSIALGLVTLAACSSYDVELVNRGRTCLVPWPHSGTSTEALLSAGVLPTHLPQMFAPGDRILVDVSIATPTCVGEYVAECSVQAVNGMMFVSSDFRWNERECVTREAIPPLNARCVTPALSSGTYVVVHGDTEQEIVAGDTYDRAPCAGDDSVTPD